MRELFSKFLVPPSGVSEDDFYNCLPCYVNYYGMADIEGFEPTAFMAEMQTKVIDPLVDTQKLFTATTTSTRLYTTMSAHEMTVDPLFDFNPDLPAAVSNRHQADRVIECWEDVDQADAPWRIVLESGQTIRGKGTDWPFATDTDAMPANSRITRVGNRGKGEVVEDNVAGIKQALAEHNGSVPGPHGGSEGESGAKGDHGCSIGNGRAPSVLAGMFMAAGLGLILVRRRRRA
jgi:MYXO-CTERM domain-containing protein